MREVSVSNLHLYEIWKQQEDLPVNWLLDRMTSKEKTEAMTAGHAFHAAMETVIESDKAVLSAEGYVFHVLCEVELAIPSLREISASRMYGDLLVKGRVDGLDGKTVTEFKTTERFDVEHYMYSCQSKFYLDLTDSDRVNWHVFEMSACGEKEYEVWGYHKFSEYRYPRLHADCVELAREYSEFADKFMPVLTASRELVENK